MQSQIPPMDVTSYLRHRIQDRRSRRFQFRISVLLIALPLYISAVILLFLLVLLRYRLLSAL